MKKEERLEKAAREARLMQLSKPKLIKVVTKVATKAGVDPKALQSSKGGQEFLKKQDDELNVLNREHLEKLKKGKSSKRKGLISIDRLSIADSSLRRSLTSTFIQTQNQFGDFGVTKWDELGAIIPKKKNRVVEDPVTSPSKKYDRLKVIPSELGINQTLHSPEQALSLSSRVQFVNNKVIEYPKHGIFFIDVFGDQAFQRISVIHKVDVDSLLSYMVMAGNIRAPENQRFCAKLKKMIDEHTDKEKLKSKKVKL
ncbi:hypothetical protein Tco_0735311 [Tanacetum coccineum]